MTSLPDVLQRQDWAGPRQESWTDYLPYHVMNPIRMNPLYQAVQGVMGRPSLPLEMPKPDTEVPMPRRPGMLDNASPTTLDAIDKVGFLANFIGPGAKLPPKPTAPAPTQPGTSFTAYHGSPKIFSEFDGDLGGTVRGRVNGAGINISSSRSYADQFNPKRNGGIYRDEGPGATYQVRVNADPSDFLDMRKPLADQPEKFLPAIQEQINRTGLKWPEVLKDKSAADALGAAGVPGSKMTEWSQHKMIPRRVTNMAVFDASLIEILRKYGLLPPVAAGAATAVTQGQDQQF